MKWIAGILLVAAVPGAPLGAYLVRPGGAPDPLEKNCIPHRLRHSFETEFLRKTNDIKAVQEAHGHADIGSTMGYAALADDRLARAIGTLTRLLRHRTQLVLSHEAGGAKCARSLKCVREGR